jgi:hypothetical protein
MKLCTYCGRENRDDATHCRECGTAFSVPEREASVETVKIEPSESPTDEPALREFESRVSQQPSSLPAEYWFICGIAIAASGYFYMVVAVVVSYLCFKHIRPHADWELLMVGSIYTGTGIVGTLQLLSSGKGPLHFMEPVIVISAAVTTAITGRRGWARFLLVYSILSMFTFMVSGLLRIPKAIDLRYAVFWTAVYGCEAWLINRWLSRQKKMRASYGK